jgi:rubrerythrin
MDHGDILFRQEVPANYPRLTRLYEQAKQDFWNETNVVDWSQPLTVPMHKRRPLARVLSIIYYGERAALEVSAQLVAMVPDEEAKFVLACQVIEEAKHVSVFRHVLEKLDEIHPVDPWSRRVLVDLVSVKSATAKLLGMQLILENVANHLFHEIGGALDDPLLKEVLRYVARDEKKHTGLAALYLPSLLEKVGPLETAYLKAKQVYWSFCIDRTIYNHRFDADALEIDLFTAMKNGIKAQERLVEQMGTRRGVWKNQWLEAATLRLYKKHQRARERAGHRYRKVAPAAG